jgi:hypothetical protein
MRHVLLFIALISSAQTFAQSRYFKLVKEADSLYNAKQFQASALAYSEAFRSNGWKATINDRYNAACSWALANRPDSSFFHLNRIATKANFSNYQHITSDPDLHSLHQDPRWTSLLEIIRRNKEKAEANLNRPLAAKLDSIYTEDQKYRQQMDEIEKKYGWESKEMQTLWKTIHEKDSVNLIKVKAILDKHGWLGPDVVGQQGNSTLFLVIQHSDQATQEKYLPMMREAVKSKKASPTELALLEDRVALGQGKRQIYGSQIGRDPDTGKYYVRPLEDPSNVDERRAQAGLPPLSEYVSHWQIEWNAEQYKRDLPSIEKKEKERKP